MIKKDVINILFGYNYKKHTVYKIVQGQRKPNPTNRYSMYTIYNIPFEVWGEKFPDFLKSKEAQELSFKGIKVSA
jgi:hypothetical protein